MFYIEGTICEANKPDCENDLLTPSDIQTLYNHSKPLKFDINHNTQALDGILVLDNYLNDVGDWCIKLISDNEHLNQQLKSGEVTGFSLSSSLDTGVCSINQCVGECQYKDYDIGCWQPEYCSFVTHPCNRLGFNICEELNGGINIDLISKLKELVSSYEEETKVETNKFSKGLVENHNPSPEEKPEEVVEEVATEEVEAEPETTEAEPEVEAKEEVVEEAESESEEEDNNESEEVADAEPEVALEEESTEEVSEEDNDEVVEVEKSAKEEKEDDDEADVKKIVKALKNDDSFKEFIIGLVNDKPKTEKSEEEAEAKEDDDKEEDNEESESKSAEDGEEDKPKTTKACKCAKSRTTKVSLGAEVGKSEFNKYDLYKSTGRDATGRKI